MKMGEAQKCGQHDQHNQHPGGIMPGFQLPHAVIGSSPNKESCAGGIGRHHEQKGSAQKRDSPKKREPVHFAQKQREHKGRLQRANSAASLVNANDPGSDLDKVAVLHSGNAQPSSDFNRNPGNETHESLSNVFFPGHGPGYGYQHK